MKYKKYLGDLKDLSLVYMQRQQHLKCYNNLSLR